MSLCMSLCFGLKPNLTHLSRNPVHAGLSKRRLKGVNVQFTFKHRIMKNLQAILISAIGLLFVMASCNDTVEDLTGTNTTTTSSETNSGTSTEGNTATGTSIWEMFNNGVTVTEQNGTMVIQSNGIPDHGSPYFEEGHAMYEAYNGSNPRFNLNPNRISEQNLTFYIPANPEEAVSKSATPMGAIGVARNGIPFYNQYAAGQSPLTNEINSFDQYNAHPQMTGQYHYHIEPLYLTELYGRDAFLGVLLDGFPVYGPEEKGRTITNADLDEYHGHFGPTPEFPEGIYHYHITDEDPYLNGDGFFGVTGSTGR